MLSRVEIILESLMEVALSNIGRFPVRCPVMLPITVVSPLPPAWQTRLLRLPWTTGPPAPTGSMFSPQAPTNLVVLALVALATFVSPLHTWKQPRRATAVKARPLVPILMFLPVLTVRRRFLPQWWFGRTWLARLLMTSILFRAMMQLPLCRNSLPVPTVPPRQLTRVAPVGLHRPLTLRKLLIPATFGLRTLMIPPPLLMLQLLLWASPSISPVNRWH